jgi:hypothetical protein
MFPKSPTGSGMPLCQSETETVKLVLNNPTSGMDVMVLMELFCFVGTDCLWMAITAETVGGDGAQWVYLVTKAA